MTVWVIIIKTWVDMYTVQPSVKVFYTEEKAKRWVDDVGGWTQWKEYDIEECHID